MSLKPKKSIKIRIRKLKSEDRNENREEKSYKSLKSAANLP